MYEIDMQEMTNEFFQCLQWAGQHLNNQVQGGIKSWLKATPYPPFLEHLSFRLGNQLFFVRVEDINGEVTGPGSFQGLNYVSKRNRGYACLMPMRKKPIEKIWLPEISGWGLINAATKKPIDPTSLITEEKIEMTQWELQDMAVQVVRDYLKKQNYKLMSWQGNPEVDPSIWFVGDSNGPEWIIVRVVKYPENRASRPENWRNVAKQCSHMSQIGHFASVALVSADQPFKTEGDPAAPLWRGYGINVNFTGLESIIQH